MNFFVDLAGMTTADLNFRANEHGLTPLMIACARGSTDFVKMMLANATLDINARDNEGLNAFWVGANFGHGDIMALLAERNADILVTNKHGANALHLACKRSFPNVVKMLVKSNFPLNERTVKGMTALAIAAYKGHNECLKILIQA